jgi:hypothetical protein
MDDSDSSYIGNHNGVTSGSIAVATNRVNVLSATVGNTGGCDGTGNDNIGNSSESVNGSNGLLHNVLDSDDNPLDEELAPLESEKSDAVTIEAAFTPNSSLTFAGVNSAWKVDPESLLFPCDIDSLRFVVLITKLHHFGCLWHIASHGSSFSKDKDLMAKHYVQVCDYPIPLFAFVGSDENQRTVVTQLLSAMFGYVVLWLCC